MTTINERLMEAAKGGSEAGLKALLLDQDCDALKKGAGNWTALIYAAHGGHQACVRLLLPVSDARAKDKSGRTALMWAACYGHEACVKLLLPLSDARAKSEGGYTALIHAACCGSEGCVKLILPESDVKAMDGRGWTARSWASGKGYEVLAQFLEAYELSQTEQDSIEEAANPATPCKRAAPRV